MARRYRFYVGADNETGNPAGSAALAAALADLGIQGASLLPAAGVWRGAVEYATVVEIIRDADVAPLDPVRVAYGLRDRFKQDSILYTVETLDVVAFVGDTSKPLRSPGTRPTCGRCDCADPTALPGLAADCDCRCHPPTSARRASAPAGSPARA